MHFYDIAYVYHFFKEHLLVSCLLLRNSVHKLLYNTVRKNTVMATTHFKDRFKKKKCIDYIRK